jgi:hypothetical protein
MERRRLPPRHLGAAREPHASLRWPRFFWGALGPRWSDAAFLQGI